MAKHFILNFILFFSLLLPVFADEQGPINYWSKLQEKSNELFKGWDITVDVNGGLEHREYFQGTRTGPYGNFEIRVPLYSKKERLDTSTTRIIS